MKRNYKRDTPKFRQFIAYILRRGAHGNVPSAVPSRAADLRQGGRREQLCTRLLHPRQGDHRPCVRQNPQDSRHVRRPARFPHLSRVRRRHRVRLRQPVDGTTVHGLRQESEARVRHISVAADLHGRRGTVQRDTDDSHDSGELGLRVSRGQRGDLRHLPAQSGYRAADLHESESADRSDRLLDHGVSEIRGRSKHRSHRVPDESRALSQDTLSSDDLRAHRIHREGLSRAAHRDGAHHGLLRAGHADGQV